MKILNDWQLQLFFFLKVPVETQKELWSNEWKGLRFFNVPNILKIVNWRRSGVFTLNFDYI